MSLSKETEYITIANSLNTSFDFIRLAEPTQWVHSSSTLNNELMACFKIRNNLNFLTIIHLIPGFHVLPEAIIRSWVEQTESKKVSSCISKSIIPLRLVAQVSWNPNRNHTNKKIFISINEDISPLEIVEKSPKIELAYESFNSKGLLSSCEFNVLLQGSPGEVIYLPKSIYSTSSNNKFIVQFEESTDTLCHFLIEV